MAISFDKTVKRMCKKKISAPDTPLLSDEFTPTEAIAEALIRRAQAGNADALKVVREILGKEEKSGHGSFHIDINVVE